MRWNQMLVHPVPVESSIYPWRRGTWLLQSDQNELGTLLWKLSMILIRVSFRRNSLLHRVAEFQQNQFFLCHPVACNPETVQVWQESCGIFWTVPFKNRRGMGAVQRRWLVGTFSEWRRQQARSIVVQAYGLKLMWSSVLSVSCLRLQLMDRSWLNLVQFLPPLFFWI